MTNHKKSNSNFKAPGPELPNSPCDPKIISHRTFQKNERLIQKELQRAIKTRTINLTARAVYESAGITSPTFYSHCRNSNDARKRYEQSLEENFYLLIPTSAKKDLIYNILGPYILRHQQYFRSAFGGSDHHVLSRVLIHYRPILTGKSTSNPAFVHYTSTIVAIVFCWGKYDHFSKTSMPDYIAKMIRTRPTEF